MSDPTYRIDVEHRPAETHWRWLARVTRLSDDQTVKSVIHSTAEFAVREAQDWIGAEAKREAGFALFVDDDGRPVEGHSVKAPS